ncbi:hypothetical protein I5192_17685 [Ruegeria sp. SCSIO 43209]|jgi:hypothetical protein|uniref:CBU_0592 family membrane protein n=1 Tax=Ruegeria sp. SCSIO 43209 TaxID=2793010 RepID=UPI00147F51F8|nr:hypothetical protein [Ruegeria sp. SCSIO 43209]UAB89019.1 hypothetical protein I5192_17685 [Ruegeria sp. SCSIO 43209]
MTALLDSLTVVDAIGSFGALIVVAAYFATQMRVMNSEDLAFPLVNLIGSVLIVFSLLQNFNLASMLIEGFWIIISVIGIIQYYRLRRLR